MAQTLPPARRQGRASPAAGRGYKAKRTAEVSVQTAIATDTRLALATITTAAADVPGKKPELPHCARSSLTATTLPRAASKIV